MESWLGSIGGSYRIPRSMFPWRSLDAQIYREARITQLWCFDESTSEPFTLLDNACGTGPIVAHLQDHIDSKLLLKSKVVCADFNQNFVNILKRRATGYNWTNLETAVVDAQVCSITTVFVTVDT
ncbi:hypothetical protein F4813DRAFT_287321 [Daldinia decipiens]|uniref:uncharacterized protein n=1 Tax=Daldinia decipiens TaxID=326647 RepID=UPI0020C4511F|nr:uncharacterized protein F4813DRAFT_287321 [Daldinia decipiens]KAI1652951.1 hypothetical protein F4813DRAFT_287321 [Daldinia decipiens]